MSQIRKTEVFAKWLDALRDFRPGHGFRPGSRAWKQGIPETPNRSGGVFELRIDYDPGYRVYFTRQGRDVVVLLAGGDKRTQSADIRTAQRLARNL